MRGIAGNGLYIAEDGRSVVVYNGKVIDEDYKLKGGSIIYDVKEKMLYSSNIANPQKLRNNDLFMNMSHVFTGTSQHPNSPKITGFYKLIDQDVLLNGMELLYNDFDKEDHVRVGELCSRCMSNMNSFLRGNVNSLPEFENYQVMAFSYGMHGGKEFRMFDKNQYVAMSIYLAVAKWQNEKYYQGFIQKPYVKNILFNMAFDFNGMCTKMEEKLAENMNSRKK